MNEDRIPLRDALARAAVPLAALAAMAALAQREVDPVAAAESVYLTVLATAGLLAVAFLAPAPAWEAGVGATLATTIVWALPPGPGRGAAMVVLLVGALAVAAARRGFSSLESFGALLPLSLGLQILLRGGALLFQPQLNLRTLMVLLAFPLVGAAATAMLARRHGPSALMAAGMVLLIAPGWNVAATLGWAALAAVDRIAGRFLRGNRLNLPGFLAVWTASLLAAGALLGSYPWLRSEPLRDAIGLFVPPPGWPILSVAIAVLWALEAWRGRRLAAGAAAVLVFLVAALRIPSPGTSLLPPSTAVVVDAAKPVWRAPVTERDPETVVLESSLSNGAGLKAGSPVATVWLRGSDGRSAFWTVRAGMETGEWAARRPDVAETAVLQSPPAWISYVAGDFFGQRYRSLWQVDAAGPFTTLTIERSPGLPQEAALAIHLLEVRK